MGNAVDIGALMSECLDAGIIWRPKDGRLRPDFTRGRPPDALLERVKAHRDEIYQALKELNDLIDQMVEDHENDSN